MYIANGYVCVVNLCMKSLVIILALFSHPTLSQADLLKSGNTFFSKNMFKEAIDAYKMVESSNKGGFGLYSNMARCYAYLGQEPLAILYFEKALVLKPGNDEIIKDLTSIRRRTADLDVPPDPFYGKKLWNALSGIFLPGTWATISLVALAIAGFLLSWRPFQKGTDKKLLTGILSLGFIFFISLSAAYYRDQQIYHNDALIITSDSIKLKAGPDQQSPDVTDLPAGSKVYKKDFLGVWTQIYNEYGDVGWIKTIDARSI